MKNKPEEKHAENKLQLLAPLCFILFDFVVWERGTW